MVLALAARRVQELPPTYLGDPHGIFGVAITAPTANSHIRVSIEADQLAQESSFEATLAEANQEYEIFPVMRFDTKLLKRTRKPFPTTVAFTVSANGVRLGTRTETVQVRSVNDVPFHCRRRDGRVADLSGLFAAFVDENTPLIDNILSSAIDWNAIQRFVGYQGSHDQVIRQVFAIWNVLQRKGVKYSSIARPSAYSEAVISQHVRFLDEVIQASQANCVEGTVLFASVLYKLGMCPVLVLTPTHMFLGVYLDRQSCGHGRNLIFLETTLVGVPGLDSVRRRGKFLGPNSYRSSESYRQFWNATIQGRQKFAAIANRVNTHQPGYRVIDIEAARRDGISAISH